MAPRRSKPKARTQGTATLRQIVGPQIYATWIEMLSNLVPDGRTHRLAPLVAGMLHFARRRAVRLVGAIPPRGSLAEALAYGDDDPDALDASVDTGSVPAGSARQKLSSAVARMFRDAKVRYVRTNARGDRYSIIDSVLIEFHQWDLMPWE